MENNDKQIEEYGVKVVADQGELTTQMAELVVTNEEEMQGASALLSQASARVKRLEISRKEFTEDLVKQKRKIDTQFKEWSAPYTSMVTKVKSAIGAYVNEQERIRREAERKEKERLAQEARDKAKDEGISIQKATADVRKEAEPVNVPAPVTSSKVAGAKMTTVQVTKFEVVDASKVPVEFKVVDERLIRQAVKDGAKRIAGVRIYQDTQVKAL
ncbi:MAG: hypothetical protein KAT71_08160 [Gammaproteobacteria bacterium]|nr:hypothetical protein [Gammaproteobacteria bacterium]